MQGGEQHAPKSAVSERSKYDVVPNAVRAVHKCHYGKQSLNRREYLCKALVQARNDCATHRNSEIPRHKENRWCQNS